MQAQDTDTTRVVDIAEAPSLLPEGRAINFAQLARFTRGDAATTHEILKVFDLQADVLVARIMSEAPKTAAARAHTLAISARSIGAWKVAEAATTLERLAAQPGPVVLSAAMSRLSTAVTEAQVEIHGLTQDSPDRGE